MTEPDGQIRIGEILVEAQLLSEADLNEALEIAKDTGQLIGGVLVMSGFVSDKQLQLALSLQRQLREGTVDFDDAIRALRRTGEHKIQ
jgi:hypothetical protein